MSWVQTYDPLDSPLLSTLAAASPILVLLTLLVRGVRAHLAALAGLIMAIAAALWVFGMPTDAALMAAVNGACFGMLPIGWIVVAAIFLFLLTLRSGQFEIVKRSVASISPDHRIQALLIAFSFGSFVEGAAGFGTPVAVSSALLVGLGFPPLQAAGLALIANTSPVAFGALGTPIITLARVSGLDELQLSQMAGRQLPFFSLLVPAWLVMVMSGWKGLRGCWPAVVVCGASFAALQALAANYFGPTLVDVIGGLGSLVCLTAFLKFWRPKMIWTYPGHEVKSQEQGELPLTRGRIIRAWMPWVILSITVFAWGLPAVKDFLNGGSRADPNFLAGISKVTWQVPRLHGRVYRRPPVAEAEEGADRAKAAEEAIYQFNWLSTTGTGIALAAVIAAILMKISPQVFAVEFLRTLGGAAPALATIACMLALAFVTKFSGMDATLGLAFTKTGVLYPLFAPMLGWLGVALTGSDTSSNAMFGSLQRITARQLGLNETLIVASNSTGGVMGKMIDAQSIVVAAMATGGKQQEGAILRFVFWHSLVLALLMGVLTLLQAYWFSWMIPASG